MLDRALLAQLPDAVEPALDGLARRAATDPDIGHLMDGLGPLGNALRYGDVRGTDGASLRLLFDEFVERILAGVVDSVTSLDDVAAALAVERLSGVQAALAMVDHPARHERFPRRARHDREGSGARPRHRTGHPAAARQRGLERRRRRTAAAPAPSAPARPPPEGAAFVEGFLAGSGTVLVHDAELLAIVDSWLASLTGEAFDGVVALLRRTFGAFEPAERRQIMTLLVAGRPVRSVTFGDGVDAERAAAALVTVRHLLGLPADAGCAGGA